MRRFILWIAAILITFAIGVGADRLWWHFLAAPPPTPVVEPVAFNPYDFAVPTYVPPPPPPPAAPPPPKPKMILDYDPLSMQVWGIFYVMGRKPKEFADLDSLEVMLNPESKEYPGQIFVIAHVGNEYANAEATFALVT